MNKDSLEKFVNGVWDDSIVPQLVDYIKIPAKSPHFDAQWADGFLSPEHEAKPNAITVISNTQVLFSFNVIFL